jgi:hypothetical protein
MPFMAFLPILLFCLLVIFVLVMTLLFRRYFYEVLAILLMAGSLVFFFECIGYVDKRNYVSAIILLLIGISVISVGKEMARLALIQKE